MGRLLKYLFILIALAIVALAGYALLGDLSPEQRDITVPVTEDAD